MGESGSCVDVNECVSNNGHGPCQDVCTNTVGSYQCSCEVKSNIFYKLSIQ